MSSRWALLGGLAIFLYVGAEVAIGTQMALLLKSSAVWGISLHDAGKLVSFYWGGAMVSRLIGSALLTRIWAPRLLALFTAAACVMYLYVFAVGGLTAGYVALPIGQFNSIMLPDIFTITLERANVSEEASSASCACRSSAVRSSRRSPAWCRGTEPTSRGSSCRRCATARCWPPSPRTVP